MGTKAKEYFDRAEREGGLTLKIRLATAARITSTEASSIEDSRDVLMRLDTAWNQLYVAQRTDRELKETTNPFAPRPTTNPGTATGSLQASSVRRLASTSDEKSLRVHLETFLDLMSQRALFLGDVSETVRRVTEAAVRAVNTARVSVWLLDNAQTKITCADLFEREAGRHSSGTELFRKDFGAYFDALLTERTIAAHDAQTDPRTNCFTEVYLKPLGIGSMLDVPIWVKGELVGVVCHEHLGGPRTWTADDERFGYLMASFVSLAMERRS